ncbi:MAG: PspC domain-containing protein [Bacteroidales bacterium]|nr:PspC domain-containing protein [Bacteroidales bacterium]MDD4603404.1 PspC domain-containing protein [Bacteroidales bacterium]
MESKRLYRSNTDKKIAGVAGGLGEYFSLDPLLFRLIFVILLLAGGGGLLIYIVLWIITPEKPFEQPANINFAADEPISESGQSSSEEGAPFTPDPADPIINKPPQTTKRKKGSLIGGLVLITLGALFLADELIPTINFGDLWPLILVAIGVGLLINAISCKNKPE